MFKRNYRYVKPIIIIAVTLLVVVLFFLCYLEFNHMIMSKTIISDFQISKNQIELLIETADIKFKETDRLCKIEMHSYNWQHSGYIEYVFVVESNDTELFVLNNKELFERFGFLGKKRDLIGGAIENTGYYILDDKIYFHIANRNYSKLTGYDKEYISFCDKLKQVFELIFSD